MGQSIKGKFNKGELVINKDKVVVLVNSDFVEEGLVNYFSGTYLTGVDEYESYSHFFHFHEDEFELFCSKIEFEDWIVREIKEKINE